MPDDVVFIARCPEHGLHGDRDECFVCGGTVEKVAMQPVEEDSAAAEPVFTVITAVSLGEPHLTTGRVYPAGGETGAVAQLQLSDGSFVFTTYPTAPALDAIAERLGALAAALRKHERQEPGRRPPGRQHTHHEEDE